MTHRQPLAWLITEARALAGEVTCAAGHAWESNGGRSCPKGLSDGRNPCSQAVYVCERCGAEDYGDNGGPAHRECFIECSREPEPEEDESEFCDCGAVHDMEEEELNGCNACGRKLV